MIDPDAKSPDPSGFDFDAFPDDTLFHDRRTGDDRRRSSAEEQGRSNETASRPPAERRAKKERRRRIDPTTFEKQYTDDELEFMNAMQRFKIQTGRGFPSHGEVLRVACSLGYRKIIVSDLLECGSEAACSLEFLGPSRDESPDSSVPADEV